MIDSRRYMILPKTTYNKNFFALLIRVSADFHCFLRSGKEEDCKTLAHWLIWRLLLLCSGYFLRRGNWDELYSTRLIYPLVKRYRSPILVGKESLLHLVTPVSRRLLSFSSVASVYLTPHSILIRVRMPMTME